MSKPGSVTVREYSPEERENALDVCRLNNGNIRKTCRQLKLATSTLIAWVKAADLDNEFRALRRQHLPNRLDDITTQLVDRIETIARTGSLAECANAIRTLQTVKGMLNPGDGRGAAPVVPDNLTPDEIKRELIKISHELQRRRFASEHSAAEQEEKAG
jgi:transposase-like protein